MTNAEQAESPNVATTTLANQPATSNSRRGIRRGVDTRRRDKAAASSHGTAGSQSAKEPAKPSAPGHLRPKSPPSAHHVLRTG